MIDIVMMRFKEWLSESVVFQTKQGSTYVFDKQKTIRNKSVHQFHDLSDHGLKEQSFITVFIKFDFAREVGMWQTSSAKKRIILDTINNKVILISFNEKQNEFGRDRNISDSSYWLEPKIGLCPLELFQKDEKIHQNPPRWMKPNFLVCKGSHPGNEIVKID